MKLLSLEIAGIGASGWSSGRLVFGERATQLFAENGSGKTPVVQSIVFALGYKVDYRDDILERCDRVILEVEAGGKRYVIRRAMKGRFDVTVETEEGQRTEFITEREYSRFLLSLWGMEDPVVTTVGNDSAHVYSHQILPLFYMDQSHGYASEYYSASKFIKDQYAEVIRLVFGLGPKNPFDKRRERNELKEKLEYLDRVVVRSEKLIEELSSDIGGPRRPHAEIDADLQLALSGLEELRESGGSAESVNVELDARLAQFRQHERALARERSELDARIRGFVQIRNEIEVEANTLSLNEEARRVFASFDAICVNESCGLFVRSSASYGKSLLYLKDQVKDLERTNSIHQRRIDEIAIEQSLVASQVSAIRSEREETSSRSPMAALVEVASQLTERVIQLKRAKHIEAELTRLESEYVTKLEERTWVQTRLSGLEGGTRSADLELLKVRNALSERIKYWLEVLRTPNVSRDVQVDSDFNVTFGGQKVSKFTGSTLTRVILAIRTAAFDTASLERGRIPRFLILDTPRQQDIARADLAEFIRELQLLASARSTQVIYSTTNHRYEVGRGDVEWTPAFPGEEHPMYLGPVASEAARSTS